MTNSEQRTCQNCKSQFTIEPDDFSFYEKMKVPPPTRCPECRLKRRMIFRNFKTLYKRPSDKSQKSMVTMYSGKVPFPVWSHDEWWFDDWDAKSYGRDFDFNKPFFEQLKDLLITVPRFGIMNVRSVNCEYSNFTAGSKNCYLVFGCVDDDGCAYGHIVWECKDSLDNLYLYRSELCYECIDCLYSYRLLYSQECESCAESIGLYDCKGCTNCIGCVVLRQKSYYIFNEEIGKEGYQKFLQENPLSSPKTIKAILEKQWELRKKIPQRHFFGSHNNNASGNHIYNAKNSHYVFDLKGGEDSKFIFTARNAVDVYDAAFSIDVELGYEVLTGSGRNILFSHLCYGGNSDIYYSDSCFGSSNLFGCVGLRNASYCVLNKQYTRDEYAKLVDRIVIHMKNTGEWGEFFPKELSAFAYNESIINEYYPIASEDALEKGYRWENEIPMTVDKQTVEHAGLPQNPNDYSDELLKEILKCETCGRNYRFISKEIQFHKQLGTVLPKECFNCRHARRMKLRNPRRLWDGKCARCGSLFKTSWPPEQQETFKIYCEQCYQAEVA